MKNMIKFASAVAVAFALTQTIQATPITGAIGFTGNVTYNTSSASTATEVTSWITPEVTAVSGTFASFITPIAPATFSSAIWVFNTGTAINNFWQAGGFSFQLLSSSIVSQGGVAGTSGFVVVSGTGIVSGNDYTPTAISWSFTSQDPKVNTKPDQWTFSASANSTSVPDGGATVMLLGIALSGVALLRKKLTA